MRTVDPALGKAVALSILLHALSLAAGGWLVKPVHGAAAAGEAQLSVALRSQLQPALLLDESLQRARRAPARSRPARKPSVLVVRTRNASNGSRDLESEAARQAKVGIPRELLYPPEAIARGLEGDALVLLVLDASGDAIAARLEKSSGHALLDDAAVRAARTLRALPASVPREVLLPVRFRLR